MTLHIKRIYEDPASGDGYRVLVDRIWPRGISKQRAKLDQWLKELAPSTELRKWFGHEDSKWAEFYKRYVAELNDNAEVDVLRHILAEHDAVTLVYSARNEEENQAVVLRDYLSR